MFVALTKKKKKKKKKLLQSRLEQTFLLDLEKLIEYLASAGII